MVRYRYKMIQIPPTLVTRKAKGADAASYLEEVVNAEAQGGWEFWRVDSIGVQVEPGCLGALAGARASHTIHYVITFRRPIPEGPA